MPLNIPQYSLKEIKKYSLEVLVTILIVLLVYFIRSSKEDTSKLTKSFEERAIRAEFKRDSLERELSLFKDALIKYNTGISKLDSATKNLEQTSKSIIKVK